MQVVVRQQNDLAGAKQEVIFFLTLDLHTKLASTT